MRENCIFAIPLTSLLYYIPERIGLFSARNTIRTRIFNAFDKSDVVWTLLTFGQMFWYLNFSHTTHPSDRNHFIFFFQFFPIGTDSLTDEATADIASYTDAVPHSDAV